LRICVFFLQALQVQNNILKDLELEDLIYIRMDFGIFNCNFIYVISRIRIYYV
jgi:hypothetical protein